MPFDFTECPIRKDKDSTILIDQSGNFRKLGNLQKYASFYHFPATRI